MKCPSTGVLNPEYSETCDCNSHLRYNILQELVLPLTVPTPASSCGVGNTAEAFWRSRPPELGQVQRPYQGHVVCWVRKGGEGGGAHGHVIYYCRSVVYVGGSFIYVLVVSVVGVGEVRVLIVKLLHCVQSNLKCDDVSYYGICGLHLRPTWCVTF